MLSVIQSIGFFSARLIIVPEIPCSCVRIFRTWQDVLELRIQLVAVPVNTVLTQVRLICGWRLRFQVGHARAALYVPGMDPPAGCQDSSFHGAGVCIYSGAANRIASENRAFCIYRQTRSDFISSPWTCFNDQDAGTLAMKLPEASR